MIERPPDYTARDYRWFYEQKLARMPKYRNANKAAYAREYAAWCSGFRPEGEPSRGKLSVMGAQAVRLDLQEITSNLPEPPWLT